MNVDEVAEELMRTPEGRSAVARAMVARRRESAFERGRRLTPQLRGLILGYLGQGMTRGEVAAECGVSLRTVARAVRNEGNK